LPADAGKQIIEISGGVMKKVRSKDGTMIAYDQIGQGPLLILVSGALQYSAFDQGMRQLADLLSKHFTVINYDRRGRGESTDTQPYALQREIEDIDALIDVAGGSASLYGISSGGALAMEAAIELGNKVKKLAIYEVPYNSDPAAMQAWKKYVNELRKLLAADHNGDAVALFMRYVGATPEQVEGVRQQPIWPLFESIASTLAYDHIAALGEDAAVPVERATHVPMPTLIVTGGASFPFMYETAKRLSGAIPYSVHRVLEGQTHEVSAEALAPVLIEFFKDS
jgi:pimeloyl-ACP methyl ester carboxylesterase